MISSVSSSYNSITQQSVYGATVSQAAAAEESGDVKKLTPEEEMAQFKKDFYDEVSKIYISSTVYNAAINVSEAAFEKMKENPEYRTEVMNLLKRDLGSTFTPAGANSMIYVGASVEDYRADAWHISYDGDHLWDRSDDTVFLKKTNTSKDRKKDYAQEMIDRMMENNRFSAKLLEERLERAAQRKNLQPKKHDLQNAVSQYDIASFSL